MKIHNPPMSFKGDDGKKYWDESLASITSDFLYQDGIHRFASEWATRMERRFAEEHGFNIVTMTDVDDYVLKFLRLHAEDLSHKADDEGISGAMYGFAVMLLAECWVAGEQLRRWHNAKYDVPPEAEGTVNPAILEVRCKGDADDGN